MSRSSVRTDPHNDQVVLEGFEPGAGVWIPCEVKPGQFSDERRVSVALEDGNKWMGLVQERMLRGKAKTGQDCVLAKVTSVQGDSFVASIPGLAFKPYPFHGRIDRVAPNDTVEA